MKTARKIDGRKMTPTKGGFALIIALVITSMLMLTVLCSMTLVMLEMRNTQSFLVQSQTRLNANVTGRIALGELQTHLGRDQTVSFPFQNHEGWLAASPTKNDENIPAPAVPLVSANFLLNTPRSQNLTWTKLAREEFFQTEKLPEITVPFLRDHAGNSFAFFIEDEAQKIDVGTQEDTTAVSFADTQIRRQNFSQNHALEAQWHLQRPDFARWKHDVASTISWGNLLQSWKKNADDNEPFLPHQRLHSRKNLGILSDTARGGLRINWDREEPLNPEEIPCAPEEWHRFTKPDSALLTKTERGEKITPSVSFPALRKFPILAGLRVRVGFFNPRSDGFHRIRFNVEAQFWNPTPYPLFTAESARIGLLDLEKMPSVQILNDNTGAIIEVDMSDFPTGQFALAKQPKSESTANAWLELYDGRRFGMDAPGLLAGEVFLINAPNPVAQPQGLSRVLSHTTWKMQSDADKPNKPPYGANGNHWFHAAHRIKITGVMPADGAVFHIREMNGTLSTSKDAAQYSAPALTLKNIPFKNFSLQMSGADYNRATSTGYTADASQVAFSLHLRGDNPELLREVLASLDPREPVLDFKDERVKKLYIVEANIVNAEDPLPRSHTESFLFDTSENNHENSEESVPFSDVRALDFPVTMPPLSVAALRHLPQSGKPAGALNYRYPSGNDTDSLWFDRAFFAGKWQDENNIIPETGAIRPWSKNPFLQKISPEKSPDLAKQNDAAAHCLIRGVFNVNCESPEAWRTLLARTIPQWHRREIADEKMAPEREIRTLENTLFRLPFGAAEPFFVGEKNTDVSDAELRENSPENFARLAGVQGFRALDENVRDRLADALADGVKKFHAENGAFISLADFALSDVLSDAIHNAGINDPETVGGTLQAFSPLRINSGDILESILPFSSVRGDTFRVRLRGGVFAPASDAVSFADAEIIVQRMPEFLDNSQDAMTPVDELNAVNTRFGRRFRILEFRWVDKGKW